MKRKESNLLAVLVSTLGIIGVMISLWSGYEVTVTCEKK